jgi:putative transposase
MELRKTLKYRLYDNRRNINLVQQIDIAGSIWNYILSFQKLHYSLVGKFVQQSQMKKIVARLRNTKYYYWKMLGSQAVQDVIERQDRVFQSFFKYIAGKSKSRKAGYPHFKKVKKYTSFTLKQRGWKYLGDNKIRIGRHNYKFSLSRPVEGNIKTVTIKRDNLGKFWICFSVIQDFEPIEFSSGKIGGFDFGLKTFLTNDEGQTYSNPQFLKNGLNLIATLNRNLSRKQKGSHNRLKAKHKLAKAHVRVANKRRDFHFKSANTLIVEYDTMFFEDLNLNSMKKLWGRKVSDLGFSSFVTILENQATKHNRTVQKIGRWEPTSQVCSFCGCIQKFTLSDRIYSCPECGLSLDRDTNAAKNILTAGASAAGLGGHKTTTVASTVRSQELQVL